MRFMCASLHRLGLLLEAAYTRRGITDNKDMKAIAEAELNLRRVHISSPTIVPFTAAADGTKL